VNVSRATAGAAAVCNDVGQLRSFCADILVAASDEALDRRKGVEGVVRRLLACGEARERAAVLAAQA